MRTSSPWRASKAASSRKTGHSRADITPFKVDGTITWDSVGGLASHIEALKEMVMLPLLCPEFYDKYKVAPPSGVLFYVPSGKAERQLRLLFEEARRNEPLIRFFDEIDGLVPVRSAKQDQIHASIVSTLLVLMDGMDTRGLVVIIGATNRLDAIDPSLRRVQNRKRLLAIHSKHWQSSLSAAVLTDLVHQTVGYCGADIKALCAEAALCSLRRVYPQVNASADKRLYEGREQDDATLHRAVSSFASPLPRAVKKLLQTQVMNGLRHVALHFPLFPLEKAAVDDAVARSSNVDERTDEEEQEEEEGGDDVSIYAPVHHVDCDICHGNEGELLGCTACPGSYHRSCLSDVNETHPKYWLCPDCRESSPTTVPRALPKRMQSLASLHLPCSTGFPRVLITGKAGMGQQYLGPALLHALEGLTHVSLDYPSLLADAHAHGPEEAPIR
ncbi:hypothetical protein PsorP6_010540 [Peronosclerospora sorghi]|uniref:Uncharacterized protein n=1 Tax=Peronosclerospora sorghi TaxID=230839 RepID=A0ACC0VWY2_9STRA|nr:hypothetical protein PsorP6_010540 [Peronosclerospora sorghi]